MRSVILALALALPANAQVLDLDVFNDTYCTLRANGISNAEAMNAGIRVAYRPGGENPIVTWQGKPTSVAAIQAATAIERACPD